MTTKRLLTHRKQLLQDCLEFFPTNSPYHNALVIIQGNKWALEFTDRPTMSLGSDFQEAQGYLSNLMIPYDMLSLEKSITSTFELLANHYEMFGVMIKTVRQSDTSISGSASYKGLTVPLPEFSLSNRDFVKFREKITETLFSFNRIR